MEHIQGQTKQKSRPSFVCWGPSGATEVIPMVVVTLRVVGSWYTRS